MAGKTTKEVGLFRFQIQAGDDITDDGREGVAVVKAEGSQSVALAADFHCFIQI